jgi:hypothetical protein
MIALLISTIWLTTLVLVVAVCGMAAHGDRARRSLQLDAQRSPRLDAQLFVQLDAQRSPRLGRPVPCEQTLSLKLESRRGAKPAREAQSPRRQSTYGTVRKRIFTSVHSDQLATYR